MSKRVLKMAGRRPILLALIMATLTLGLLFSGWLMPISVKAQAGGGNPASGNENTNCPNYTTNVVPSCPSIINHGSLAPMTFCVKLGDPLPDPTYTPGTATAGSVTTTITETCSNTVTTSTAPVSYSFSWYYSPAKPHPSVAGTCSTTAYENCVSSDTNHCSSPGVISLGTVIWNVVDNHPNTVACSYDASLFETPIDKFPAAAPGGFIKDVTITVGAEGSKETGQECCPSTGAPDNYTKYSGTLSAKCAVDVVVPGWSWVGYENGTDPFYYIFVWNATVGPTVTLTPSGTITLSGKTTDPDCGGCFNAALAGTCGLNFKLGATASVTVELFETNHWYTVNDTFIADLSGDASTSASIGGQYSTGTDCGTQGLSGATFSIGGVDLTGTAQLTVDGVGFSFQHLFHAWDGWSYP
jgi:hypothetical protein